MSTSAAAAPGPSTVPHPSLPVDASYRLVPSFQRNRPYVPEAAARTSDDESEWEYSEDEELVTLDLGRWGQEHNSAGDSSQLAITALETPAPWLQRGQVVYKGQWARLVGTEILLERTRDMDGQPSMRPLPQRRATSGEPSTTRSRILFTPATPIQESGPADTKPNFPHVRAQGGRIVSDAPPAARKKRIDSRTYAQDWMAKVENVLERREVLYSRGELPANGKMRMSQAELARRRERPSNDQADQGDQTAAHVEDTAPASLEDMQVDP